MNAPSSALDNLSNGFQTYTELSDQGFVEVANGFLIFFAAERTSGISELDN